MATLAPMIGGDIAVNQPIQPVGNALTTLLNAFTDPRSTPTKGPTEKEKTGVYLSGLAKELGKLKKNYDAGALTPEQFNTKSRGLRRAALTEMPEYSSEITGLFEDFGFTKETPMKTARDVANEQFNSVTAREDFQLDFAVVKNKNPNLSDEQLIDLAYSRNVSRRANQQTLADIELGKQVNWVEVEDVYVGQTRDMSTTLSMLIDTAQQDQILSPDEAIQIQKFYDDNLRGLRKPTGVRDEEWNSFQDNYVKPMNVIVDAAIGVAGERGIDKWTSRALKEIMAVAVSQGKIAPDVLTMLSANNYSDIGQVLEHMSTLAGDGSTFQKNYSFVLGSTFDELLAWVTEFENKSSIEDLYVGPDGTTPTKEDFTVWNKKSAGDKVTDLRNSPAMISAAGSPANKAVAIYNLYSKLGSIDRDALTPSMLGSIFNEAHYRAISDIYKENSLIGLELAGKAIEAIGTQKRKIGEAIESMADEAGLSIREGKLYPDYNKADPNVRAFVDQFFGGDFNEFVAKRGKASNGITNTGITAYLKAMDEVKKQLDLLAVFEKNSKILQDKYIPKEVLEEREAVGGGGDTGEGDVPVARVSKSSKGEMKGSAGADTLGEDGSASSVDGWISRMAVSESGGDYSEVNSEGYTGLLQFGQDRLDDYNRANGTSWTLAEFKDDPDLQDKVNIWHVNDIDRVVQAKGYLEEGYSLDGLRAVAHLGGIPGMIKFVESKGAYNPSDSNGTSLSAYYRKFAGSNVGLPVPTSRPEPRPKDLDVSTGATDSAVATSIRPRARPQIDPTAGEAGISSTARVEGTSDKEASQKATQGLSERTVAMLQKLGVDPAGVVTFATEEELNAAIKNGSVKEGDFVAVGQEVFQL